MNTLGQSLLTLCSIPLMSDFPVVPLLGEVLECGDPAWPRFGLRSLFISPAAV